MVSREEAMQHEEGIKDRRVQKTKNLLHQALGSLIREKPYDAIVVKEILDRANVGRSTFYTHFRNKDELLLSGIHEMLAAGRPIEAGGSLGDRILWFSRPILDHIEGHRRKEEGSMGLRGRQGMHERLSHAIS